MHAEAFHHILKIVYLKHKQNRCLDVLIYVLLQIAQDKAYEHLLKIEKGKHGHRVRDINKRHKNAELFHGAQITCKNNNEYCNIPALEAGRLILIKLVLKLIIVLMCTNDKYIQIQQEMTSHITKP